MDKKGQWTPQGFRKHKADFDRIYFKSGKAFCCDAKMCGLNRFPCDKIKKSQLDKLMDVGQAVPAGYLIYFYNHDRVVWFNWQELWRVFTGPEKSLHCQQGIYLGGLHTFRFDPIFDLK